MILNIKIGDGYSVENSQTVNIKIKDEVSPVFEELNQNFTTMNKLLSENKELLLKIIEDSIEIA